MGIKKNLVSTNAMVFNLSIASHKLRAFHFRGLLQSPRQLEIHSPVTWLEVFDVLPPSINPFSANLMAQPTQSGTYASPTTCSPSALRCWKASNAQWI